MFMVVFCVLLKITFLSNSMRVFVCLLLASFVGLSWEYASDISKSQFADWFQNRNIVLDLEVLLTVDIFLQISFCILEAKRISGVSFSKSDNVARNITLYIPGILIFPTLFAILAESIFEFPGTDFFIIAWSLAAFVIIFGSLTPLLIKWLLPEWDLRILLIFIINVMIAIFGVLATVDGHAVIAESNSLRWQPLIGIILFLLIGSICGFLIFRHKSLKPKTKI